MLRVVCCVLCVECDVCVGLYVCALCVVRAVCCVLCAGRCVLCVVCCVLCVVRQITDNLQRSVKYANISTRQICDKWNGKHIITDSR